MFLLHTEIDIDAPPSTVWEILTDAAHFADWNPFIHELDGELRVGEQLSIAVGLADERGKGPMRFKPFVLEVERDRVLRWQGKLLVRGLVDGEHVFELQPTEAGTHFVHYERFTGMLVPLIRGMLERDTRPGFEAMNAALKARAERMHHASAH